MASSAMVYAGAPLFMWIYSVRAAVFINNIAAKYYRLKDVWATPHHVVHEKAFADSSIVVPFGCGALILRDSDDRPKFQTKCTLMIFLRYADDHPLFTYAFFSPRTKRVLYRQDAIFLTTLFPMRAAREASGLDAGGERLVTFRSPISLRDVSPLEFSFGAWKNSDALPDFEDDVTGFNLVAPPGNLVHEPTEIPELPVHVPDYSGFPPSVVSVPIPASASLQLPGGLNGGLEEVKVIEIPGFFPHHDKYEAAVSIQPHPSQTQKQVSFLPEDISPGPRRSKRTKAKIVSPNGSNDVAVFPVPAGRKVKDRWYYENGKELTLPRFSDSDLIEGSSTVPLALLSTHPTQIQSDLSQLTEGRNEDQGEIMQSAASSSDGLPGASKKSDCASVFFCQSRD
jgi:hypothetical protein